MPPRNSGRDSRSSSPQRRPLGSPSSSNRRPPELERRPAQHGGPGRTRAPALSAEPWRPEALLCHYGEDILVHQPVGDADPLPAELDALPPDLGVPELVLHRPVDLVADVADGGPPAEHHGLLEVRLPGPPPHVDADEVEPLVYLLLERLDVHVRLGRDGDEAIAQLPPQLAGEPRVDQVYLVHHGEGRGVDPVPREDVHKLVVSYVLPYHHIGLLRAKIAKLKAEQEEQRSRRSGARLGYDVRKSGDATVVLIGLPSVGKSTLLNRLTNAKSKVAAYQFTTLDVVPGVMEHSGAKIQVLDLPGIIKGASSGKGLGKRVLAVARSADLVLFVVDVFQPEARELLERELRTTGIRVDERPPNIVIEKVDSGGISVTSQVKLTRVSEPLVKDILRVYDVNGARVVIREDITHDQL
ncbi:MAG: 50S ribosome-binding GTPase, partial [Nitrososphaerota archaeon]|nr:50S ribosome-binding GTPase [Nitrososphaerota archaeon]